MLVFQFPDRDFRLEQKRDSAWKDNSKICSPPSLHLSLRSPDGAARIYLLPFFLPPYTAVVGFKEVESVERHQTVSSRSSEGHSTD